MPARMHIVSSKISAFHSHGLLMLSQDRSFSKERKVRIIEIEVISLLILDFNVYFLYFIAQ